MLGIFCQVTNADWSLQSYVILFFITCNVYQKLYVCYKVSLELF